MAKACASAAGREVTAAAIQAHGGIGFTWEADVHWLYKRAQIDAALLGGAKRHRAPLAGDPRRSRRRLGRRLRRGPVGSDRLYRPPLIARLAISWLTNALVLAVVAAVLSRVYVRDGGSLLLAAAVFGVLNTILKPLLRFVTLPLALLTLGAAWFFVSMLMLVVTDDIVGGFRIDGFWTLVGATLIVWAVNMLLDHTPGPWQITGRRRRRAQWRVVRRPPRSEG